MPRRDIVVIGASAGGREAIVELSRKLPADFPAPIFIVWHMPPSGTGILPYLLSKYSQLKASTAKDGEEIVPGQVYCAPVDHHLLIEPGRIRVTKGPRENRFRPAIDPLFRSAAYAYGPRVIGIILSGALNDGTSGLWAIKDRGGVAIVQDPADALVAGMPESALQNVEVDHRVPVSEMAQLLMQLVSEPIEAKGRAPVSHKLEIEVKIAKEDRPSEKDIQTLGQVSEFTCPECHGTLWQLVEGNNLRFRCRTGHAYSADALLEDMNESIEAMEWAAIRGIEESAVLMEHLARHLNQSGQADTADRFIARAVKARKRSEQIRDALFSDNEHQPEEEHGNAPT
ncbi:MAG TPA: chemotaxis protein CheB [Anaerolineae bacterium]|nr:chemotaxis protein CheB [Anaerolineae bacterium]